MIGLRGGGIGNADMPTWLTENKVEWNQLLGLGGRGGTGRLGPSHFSTIGNYPDRHTWKGSWQRSTYVFG
jgi:hypothetical protein